MLKDRLERLLAKRCTLLGVGPMSVNCVDAVIELANANDLPLMLVASRRQIDAAEFGGGYVNNWTSEKFADYVIDHDRNGKVILARDHGGPWQHPVEKEKGLSLRRAMESAMVSLKADIDAGFQILHIDTSVDIHGRPSTDEVLDRVFELYEFCWSYAQKVGRKILFEVGTEEQSGSTYAQEEISKTLEYLERFCLKNKLPLPFFVVIQNGTRVMETRNVGSLDSPLRVADEIPPEIQIPKMVEVCRRFGILMKVHNTDYLSDDALQWYPRLGIHAANVAPEFGVAETKAFVGALERFLMSREAERFLQIAYESKKWDKWMLSDTRATDRDRAIIAGHYVFSRPEVVELKAQAREAMKRQGFELDSYLKEQVKKAVYRYIRNFRLVLS